MNTSIDHILFPTDFSENAENALIYALEIAERFNATLHILHSVEEPYEFVPLEEGVKVSVREKVSSLLHTLEEDIRNEERFKHLRIKTYIQTRRTAYAILDEIDRHPLDLIVMGTKGRSREGRMLMGSTTSEIVQNAKVPVLAVPRQAAFSSIERILFATDYREGDLEALTYVSRLANHFNSSVTVFHSSLENDLRSELLFRGFRELVKEKLDFKSIDFEEKKDIVLFEAVADEIEIEGVSMVAMVRYVQSSSLFSKKHSKEMSYYIKVPLLVLPGEMLSDEQAG